MISDTTIPRVVVTDAALDLLAEIRAEHGPVVFQLSAGCCDGSGPMCFRAADVHIGAHDVRIGAADGADIWASAAIATLWDRSQLILDVTRGSGNGFSLDNGRVRSFVTRARIPGDGEAALCPLPDPQTR